MMHSSDSAFTYMQPQPAAWPGHSAWGGHQAAAAAGPRLGLPGSALAGLVHVPSGFHQQQVQQEQWQQQQEQRQQISAMLMPHADPATAAAAAAAASGGDALTFQYNPGAFGSSFRPAAPPAPAPWLCGPHFFGGTSSSNSLLSGGGASQQLAPFAAAGSAGAAAGAILQGSRYQDSSRALQTFPDQQSCNQLAAARSAAAAAANAAAMARQAPAAGAGTRHRSSSDDGRAGAAAQQRQQQQQQQREYDDGRPAAADHPLDGSDGDADEEAAAALLLGLAAGEGVTEAADSSRSKRARQPSRKLEAALEQEPVLQALLDESERGSLSRLGSSSAAAAGVFRQGPGYDQQQQQRKRRKFVLSSKTPVAETIAAKVQYAASHFPELQMKHAGLEQEHEEDWAMGDHAAAADDFAFAAGGEAGPQAAAAEAAEPPPAEAPADRAAATAVAMAGAAPAEAAAEAAAAAEAGESDTEADGAADSVPAALPGPSSSAVAAADGAGRASQPGPGPAAAAAFASPGADSSTAEHVLAAIQVQQLLALRQESEQGAAASGSPAYSGLGKNRGGRPKGSGNRTQMAPRAVNRAGQPGFALRSVRYTGVYQSKRAKDGWRAQFCYSNKVLNLGTYCCEDDAARAWNAAALYFRGDAAWLNPVVPQLPPTYQPGILQGPAAAVATAAAIKLAQAEEEAAAQGSWRG